MPKIKVKCANPNCKGVGYVEVYPYRLKTTKNFYCCKECMAECYSQPVKEQITVKCDLEGCENIITMTQKEFDKSEKHFCCRQHHDEYKKKRVIITCALEGCNNTFELPLNRVQRGEKHYCCKEHQNLSQMKRTFVTCDYEGCRRTFEATPSDLAKGQKHYCCEEHRILAMKTNKYDIFENYAELVISSRLHGEVRVKIDKEDVEKCKQLTWIANYNQRLNRWYIQNITYKNGKGITTYLHRYVMDCPNDKEVDHIFHDAFDCRKQSLQIVTREENLENRKITKHNTTGYLNVSKDKATGKYYVVIRKNGKTYYGGRFNNIEEANLKAIEIRNSIMTNNILDRLKEDDNNSQGA